MAVGAGYLYYNVTDKDVDDGMVFAQVSIPISDWWGGAHALKKARIDEMQAENDRQEAREMLAVEIERTWSEVQEAYAQILLMQRSVASATENLRQNRNFYHARAATLTDLLDAETLDPRAATTSPRPMPPTTPRSRNTCASRGGKRTAGIRQVVFGSLADRSYCLIPGVFRGAA